MLLRICFPALLAIVWAIPGGAAERGPPHRPAHRDGAPAAVAPAPSRYASGLQTAPTPNQDITAPSPPEETRPHVTPTLFRLNNSFLGDGYVYGSSPQAMDDTRATLIPGLSLTMPLR